MKGGRAGYNGGFAGRLSPIAQLKKDLLVGETRVQSHLLMHLMKERKKRTEKNQWERVLKVG